MKTSIAVTLFLILSVSFLKADEVKPVQKIFNKQDIAKLADRYINNNFQIKNPVVVDVDEDGDFDILNFTDKGKVEYYKNTGSLESPLFILENKNFDNYEVSSFLPNGMPVPVFLADKDGDKDMDLFGIVKEDSKNEVLYIENIADLDHYTLITIILILVIVALIVIIAR